MIQDQSFLTESGFQAYREYVALKRHFTSSYDYFKYNGKVNVTYDSFMVRKDAYSFQRLSKKKDYKEIILSNVVENPKIWVGSLIEDSSNQIFLAWKKRTDAITAHVSDNLSKLDDNFKSNFISVNGQYPKLVDLYLRKEISLETLCILTKLTNSMEYWSKSVNDRVLFPDITRLIDKYHPFLVYPTDKIKKVVKDHFF